MNVSSHEIRDVFLSLQVLTCKGRKANQISCYLKVGVFAMYKSNDE